MREEQIFGMERAISELFAILYTYSSILYTYILTQYRPKIRVWYP